MKPFEGRSPLRQFSNDIVITIMRATIINLVISRISDMRLRLYDCSVPTRVDQTLYESHMICVIFVAIIDCGERLPCRNSVAILCICRVYADSSENLHRYVD